MKINLEEQLINYKTGEPLEVAKGKSTVRDYLDFVIVASDQTDPKAEAIVKFERHQLSKKLFLTKDKEIELTSEQITDLKNLAGKSLSVMGNGLLTEILER